MPSVDYEALSVAFGTPATRPRSLLRRSRNVSQSFPSFVIAAIADAGFPLTSAVSHELERARTRRTELAEVHADVERALKKAVQVVKGPSLAASYPATTPRHVGDLDLWVEDERDAWSAARAIQRRWTNAEIDVAYLGWPRQIAIQVRADPPDYLLEADLSVDIFTTYLVGNHVVPVRESRRDWSESTMNFLALGEERLQRPFRMTDFIDVAMLDARIDASDALSAAASVDLLDECRELVGSTSEHFEAPNLVRALELFAAAPDGGSAQPRAHTQQAVGEFDHHLATGGEWHGLPLPTIIHAEHHSTEPRHLAGHWFLIDDVGTFLLCPTGEVEEGSVEDALQVLAETYGAA